MPQITKKAVPSGATKLFGQLNSKSRLNADTICISWRIKGQEILWWISALIEIFTVHCNWKHQNMLWTKALLMLTFLLQIPLPFSILPSAPRHWPAPTIPTDRSKYSLFPIGFGQWGLPSRNQRQGREWGQGIYSSLSEKPLWTGSSPLSTVTASCRKLILCHFLSGCQYLLSFFIHLGLEIRTSLQLLTPAYWNIL